MDMPDLNPLNLLQAAFDTMTDLNVRVGLAYLASMAVIAFVVWRVRGQPGGFLSWLVPRGIYLHKSHFVDLKVMILSRVLAGIGFFSVVLFTPTIAFYTTASLALATSGSYDPPPVTFWRMAMVTLIVVAVYDCAKYWVHRVHHQSTILWPFHSVHHSAEVLTPFTTARVHPVFRLVQLAVFSVLVGLAQGVLLFLLIGEISILTIGGANVIYFAFNLIGNLHHSHIWISYGRVMNHIFMSPCQHQVHHSLDPKHHNKNYGEVFAIWDWMFGTLYVPDGHEDLEFGLADSQGRRIEQPHPTLRAAMLVPFKDSWRAIRRKVEGRAQGQGQAPVQTQGRRPDNGPGNMPATSEQARADAARVSTEAQAATLP